MSSDDSVKTEGCSFIENVIGMLLWELVFFLTVFNICINSSKSLLFFHMRIVWSPYTVLYAVIAVLMVILCNFVLDIKRNLATQIFASFIVCGLTIGIFYFKINPFAIVVISAMILLIGICVYRIISYLKKNPDLRSYKKRKYVSDVYSHTFHQLGALFMLFCVIVCVNQGYQSWLLNKKEKNTVEAEIWEELGDGNYFDVYMRKNADVYETLSSDEYVYDYLYNSGDIRYEKVREQLQTFSDYFLNYLGVDERPEVVLTDKLIGDDEDAYQDGKIYISDDYIKYHMNKADLDYTYVYQILYSQDIKLYHKKIAEEINIDQYKDSNLQIIRMLRAWKIDSEKTPMGIDNELIEEHYDHVATTVSYNITNEAWDYAFYTASVYNRGH